MVLLLCLSVVEFLSLILTEAVDFGFCVVDHYNASDAGPALSRLDRLLPTGPALKRVRASPIACLRQLTLSIKAACVVPACDPQYF